jgi:hypothetical protein
VRKKLEEEEKYQAQRLQEMYRLEKDHQVIKEKEFIFQDQNIMMTSLSML